MDTIAVIALILAGISFVWQVITYVADRRDRARQEGTNVELDAHRLEVREPLGEGVRAVDTKLVVTPTS